MRDPAATLARKFAQRDRIASQLRAIETDIASAVRDYSYARGYRVPLRVEAVRRDIGA